MPIDLFAQQNSSQQQPIDLFAQNGIDISSQNSVPRGTENTEKQMNFPESVARHTGATLSQWGHNLINIPNSFNKNIPGLSDFDYYKAWGVPQTGGDKFAVDTLDFLTALGVTRGAGGAGMKALEKAAPKAAEKAAQFIKNNPWKTSALENTAAGGAYGAMTSPEGEKLQNTAVNAALGLGGAGVAGVANQAIVKPLAKSYAHSAIPGLIERAGEKIKEVGASFPGSEALKSAYITAKDKASNLLTKVEGNALRLDEMRALLPNAPFRATPYKNYIRDFVKEKKSLSPVQSEAYKQAINFAETEASRLVPNSFKDVVQLRQNLNGYLKSYLEKNNIKKADYHTESFIKDLKNQLNTVIDKNTPKFMKKDVSQFKNDWEAWNKSYGKSQEFKKGIGKGGELVNKKSLRTALGQEGAPDSAIIGEFMPKPGQTGIAGFKQLENNLGNKAASQESIRSYLLRDIIENGGTTKDVANIYGKLSPSQRKYTFGGKKEEKLLQAANQAMQKIGRPAERQGLHAVGHHLVGLGLPGMVGFLGATESGMPIEKAMGVGLATALVTKGAGKLAAKYASPASVVKAANIAKKGAPLKGYVPNYLFQQSIGSNE